MRIIESVLFAIVTFVFCLLTASLAYSDLYERPIDPGTLRMAMGIFIVWAWLLYRWGRRLWRIWRTQAQPKQVA